ncbi:MAG TPA: hypothetical protein VLK34_10350 [Nocardioidaceae bacterium]|nr:hypothetical protein [Nocardioidaceae bacterium]
MTLAQTPTEVASDPPAERPSAAARKVAAVAAALFAVALFMTVASVDVPHDPTDSDLLQWWQQQGNRTSGLASGISAICVAVAVAVVMNYLPRLAATKRAPQWTAFARSMGAAVSAVWLVTGAARAAVSHLVDVMGEPLPGVDVLRFATALNYTLLGLSGMAVLSLCILAVSIVVFRTDALGRWVGFVGVGCGAVMLAAVVAQYGGFATPLGILWGLCLAVAIWRQPVT